MVAARPVATPQASSSKPPLAIEELAAGLRDLMQSEEAESKVAATKTQKLPKTLPESATSQNSDYGIYALRYTLHVLLPFILTSSQVLQTLEALTNAEPTKPFKISDTYKAAWEARACASEGEGENEEKPRIKSKARPKKPKKKGQPKKSKTLKPSGPSIPKKRVASDSTYQPHVYREQRGKFITASREKGMSYTTANMAWNLSKEKAALLSGLEVNELIRRRFLPAGSVSNPWS